MKPMNSSQHGSGVVVADNHFRLDPELWAAERDQEKHEEWVVRGAIFMTAAWVATFFGLLMAAMFTQNVFESYEYHPVADVFGFTGLGVLFVGLMVWAFIGLRLLWWRWVDAA